MNKEYPIPIRSIQSIYLIHKESKVKYWFYFIICLMASITFLPWTQNIKSAGKVTSLYPQQRPQEVNSPIPGRITKWSVKEGDMVKKGDTLLTFAEIKPEYLDPNLIKRTQEQLSAKFSIINAYNNKLKTTDKQSAALASSLKLKTAQIRNKIGQTENKLESENADLSASNNELLFAKDQYQRQQSMYEKGLVSQTQLQQRNVVYQNVLAKKIGLENKVAQTNQELINLRIEINSIEQDYNEKVSKVQSEQFATIGLTEYGNAEIAKLQNQLDNYKIRQQQYHILAPQDGQVVQANNAGIGEIIKEGEHILKIVPSDVSYAVEMFIRPTDLSLLDKGQKVRFTFDGFPVIVFSGWPKNSYGTFGGQIATIENTINDQGYFRVMVEPDPKEKPWPPQLKIGLGTKCITLLNDVPIWYELWRNINGFPPDYYKKNTQNAKEK